MHRDLLDTLPMDDRRGSSHGTMLRYRRRKGKEGMGLEHLLRPEFVSLTLFLVGLGSVLKYRTPLDNRLIPVVLFGVAFAVASAIGYAHSQVGGWNRVIDTLVDGGLVNGGVATGIAVWGWDTFFGLYKKGHKGGDKR